MAMVAIQTDRASVRRARNVWLLMMLPPSEGPTMPKTTLGPKSANSCRSTA
ncbi:MAG: hypothetical protein C207_00542 [Bradyrhizobium sp. DFCI-1]|jgi:hypothetical protein|nr:MAG: hypothetical protein C207_00542 [Bradyrhizobium sp. DFCI-1]